MSSQKAKITNCSIINVFDLYKSQYHQTPGRFVSFISTCFGGSTSDQQICERSALSTLCDSGHSVMVDKGFNVHDLFAPSNVTINIPTFFHKKNRMTGKTVLKDRLASEITFVCFMLCNFKKSWPRIKSSLLYDLSVTYFLIY